MFMQAFTRYIMTNNETSKQNLNFDPSRQLGNLALNDPISSELTLRFETDHYIRVAPTIAEAVQTAH